MALALTFLALSGCDRGSHPGQIGKPAPDIVMELQDNATLGGAPEMKPDGIKTSGTQQPTLTSTQRTQLDKYRGKVVVLNLWASWCPPCLEEFPSLIELQQRMPDVAVLAVSFDTDAAAYKQYLVDNHITLHTALDITQRTNGAFGTRQPPETFIIDRQGIIRRKFIGAVEWTNPEVISYLRNL